MKYNLERRVRVEADTKFKGLYHWCLQELATDGKQVGSDQIPWSWSLYFQAVDLAVHDIFEIERDFDVALEDAPPSKGRKPKKVVREKRLIKAKLISEAWGRYPRTRFSMFGTDRRLNDMSLQITSLADDEPEPICRAGGSPSYTAGRDWEEETTDDWFYFHLSVPRETFDRYAAQIAAGGVTSAQFRVGAVSGFYAAWSPDIFARDVKILTSLTDQEVDRGSDTTIEPPRVGTVGEAMLTLSGACAMTVTEADDEDSDVAQQRAPSSPLSSTGYDPAALRVLSSMRLAGWLIFAALVLLLLK